MSGSESPVNAELLEKALGVLAGAMEDDEGELHGEKLAQVTKGLNTCEMAGLILLCGQKGWLEVGGMSLWPETELHWRLSARGERAARAWLRRHG